MTNWGILDTELPHVLVRLGGKRPSLVRTEFCRKPSDCAIYMSIIIVSKDLGYRVGKRVFGRLYSRLTSNDFRRGLEVTGTTSFSIPMAEHQSMVAASEGKGMASMTPPTSVLFPYLIKDRNQGH